MTYPNIEIFPHSTPSGDWVICRMSDLMPHANRVSSQFDAASYRFAIYTKQDYDDATAGRRINEITSRYVTCVFTGFLFVFNPVVAAESLSIAKETVRSLLNNNWSEEEYWFGRSVGVNSAADIIAGLKGGSFVPDRKNP